MADGTAKPVIFISYSHKDEPKNPGPNDECWLTFVQSHLQPAVKHGIYDLWVDEDIPGGGTWRTEIDKKLAECDVCVLLVSRHSLASDFIIDVEIETLRKRREKGEVEIFPIVLTHCAVATAPWIKEINLRPPNGQPLSDFEENARNKQMAAIAEEIAGIAEEIAKRRLAPKVFPVEAHSGFGIEILAGVDTVGPDAKRRFEISHLPETAYERLVGRDDELKRLDEAWANSKTNIISLIAEGGAGKSALVNEWLKRLQADNYRSAEAALGWSFYSQGSKERATSAEGFLDWALDKLGIAVTTTNASAKGEAIAEAMAKRRALLVLDGVEPLQHGLDRQQGELKDAGLRALLRRFASTPPEQAHGLIVLTSRLAVKDIARWQDGATPVENVDRLSDEAGAALLRDNGVWGTDKELKAAAHDFGGHPLALGLLASFLKETQTGDVRRRDHIRAFFADPDNPRHDHAKRVMESYEKEWLAGQPVLLAIMQMVGLFDRPASGDCLSALRSKPAIKGLTDRIIKLDDREWQRAVARLREVRLLAPPDPAAPDALDAHPLVREWFGDRLKATNVKAWCTAHGRLFEHLRDTTKEGDTPTLEDLAPLYQAIAHGCRAGRHQEALYSVYIDRVCRRGPNGEIEFYAGKKLGALGSELAAMSWFFDDPYVTPAATLTPPAPSWVLWTAAFALSAQGRFAEALPAMREALRMAEEAKHWRNAAIAASNLSQVQLVAGEVAAAVTTANRSVAHADGSGDEFQMMARRAAYGDTLHAAGQREAAIRAFADAERRQKKWQPANPLLYSVRGYQYCDLLLAQGNHTAARDRARQTVKWATQHGMLLDIALDALTLGRADLGLALSTVRTDQMSAVARNDARVARVRLDEAVDGLRASGQSDDLPRGLLARATFRCSIGDWDGAARDLDEVEEIAEPGPMRRYLCDMELGRARLAFTQIEAFAPLNGFLEKDNPPRPEVPSGEEIVKLSGKAEKQLKIAADYIETCGYHRRDEELAELQAVLGGDRNFADLPPRV